jgi:hypothetical protein
MFHGSTSASWQNFFISWFNLSLLAKPLYFMVQPLPFGKTFDLPHGLTFPF